MQIRDSDWTGLRRLRSALCLVSAVALAGCFDIEQELVLNEDLSGTASMRMAIDMEPIVYFMAMMSRGEGEAGGAPSEAELQAVREQLLAQQEQEGEFDVEAFRAAQGESLPAGVRVLDADFSRQELQFRYAVAFEFDRLEDIVAIRLDDPARVDPSRGNPVERPFGALRLEDDGETLLLTTAPINPAAEQHMGGQPPPEMGAALAGALEGMRFALSIDAPFEVIEHNATEVAGSTLIWEYDSAALTGAEGPPPDQIYVRYRR